MVADFAAPDLGKLLAGLLYSWPASLRDLKVINKLACFHGFKHRSGPKHVYLAMHARAGHAPKKTKETR
jgi:hypothetical protein